MEDTLMHYGILGMKWGVRRTPEQLGHVKKGTKMYRVSPNPDEKEEGSTYVTYLPPDRDMYRGTFANGIRNYYSLSPSDPLYESVYKNKTDLKIPSRERQSEVVNSVLQKDQQKLLKNLAKTMADEQVSVISKNSEILKQRYKDAGIEVSTKEAQQIYIRDYGNGKGVETAKEIIARLGNKTPDELFSIASSRFGTERVMKEAVIQELKKEGYNAMIDQAGVGGRYRPIEGYAPIIVFDRSETLDKQGSKQITAREESSATTRNTEWLKRVNSNRKRAANW